MSLRHWQLCELTVEQCCWWVLTHLSPLPSTVTTLLNQKLCESDSGKHVSVSDLPGDVLIVPQATLGGKAKGKAMQYHNNIGKEEGLQLYANFVSLCERKLASSSRGEGTVSATTVKHGTYGNRQVLKLDTNGPYTHLVEFWTWSCWCWLLFFQMCSVFILHNKGSIALHCQDVCVCLLIQTVYNIDTYSAVIVGGHAYAWPL